MKRFLESKIEKRTSVRILGVFLLLVSPVLGENLPAEDSPPLDIHQRLLVLTIIDAHVSYENGSRKQKEFIEDRSRQRLLLYWVATRKFGEKTHPVVEARILNFSNALVKSERFRDLVTDHRRYLDDDHGFRGFTFSLESKSGEVKEFAVETRAEFDKEMKNFLEFLQAKRK